LEGGLYANDWSAFGAFVAAPVGGLLWGFGAFGLRITVQYIIARMKGHRFDAFDRPAPVAPSFYTGGNGEVDADEQEGVVEHTAGSKLDGKFF